MHPILVLSLSLKAKVNNNISCKGPFIENSSLPVLDIAGTVGDITYYYHYLDMNDWQYYNHRPEQVLRTQYLPHSTLDLHIRNKIGAILGLSVGLSAPGLSHLIRVWIPRKLSLILGYSYLDPLYGGRNNRHGKNSSPTCIVAKF